MDAYETSKSLSRWQLIFLRSKVNGAPYRGEYLPGRSWNWPENTYLQRRLSVVRYQQLPEELALPKPKAMSTGERRQKHFIPYLREDILDQSV